MSGFGGTIKLTGEAEYRKALGNITRNLKLVSAQMKASSSAFDAGEKSMKDVSAESGALKKSLDAQKAALESLKSRIGTLEAEYSKTEAANRSLVAQYEAEKAKLAQLKASLGTSSQEYRQQEQAVADLGKEVAESTRKYESQGRTLVTLKTQTARAEATYGQTRKAADALGSSLGRAGNEAREAGRKAKSGSGGFTVMKGALANFTGNLLSSAVSGIKSLGRSLSGIGKQAVGEYGEMEQLEGGVKKIFGADLAREVEKNAQKAFQTAGMSANEYMENVTGFSATLMQGLGKDTEKAAEYADMAMTDMSDNANTFGTDISAIQRAYQGFAKDNYTMLDNLKLGYGGTAGEMARLVNESGVLGDRMKVDAKTIRDLPFQTMIQAINETQKRMHIMGTTSREASGTVEGSVGSMRAAWKNLLAGIADGDADLSGLAGKLADSVVAAGKNLAPVVARVAGTIFKTLKEKIPSMMDGLFDMIKKIVPAGMRPAAEAAEGIFDTIRRNKDTAVAGVAAVASAYMTLQAAQKAAQIAQAALNAAMNATPAGIITAAVAALAGAVGFLAVKTAQEKGAAEQRDAAARKQLETVQKQAAAYDQLKQSQAEQAQNDLAGVANAQRLKGELSMLADETGRVAAKDRERAQYILGELNDALGTEYSMTGLQIRNYKSMNAEIDKQIAKKRAQILLNANEAVYTEAVKKRAEAERQSAAALTGVVQQQGAVNKKKRQLEDINRRIAEAQKWGDVDAASRLQQDKSRIENELEAERSALDKKKKAYSENEATLRQYYKDIESYEKASTAIMSGNTEKAVKILDGRGSAFTKAKDLAGKSAEEQKKILGDQVVETEKAARLMKERYKEGVSGVTKEMVATAQKQADQAKAEFQRVGGDITRGIKKGAEDSGWELNASMEKIVEDAVEAAKKAGDIGSPSKRFAKEVGQWISKGIARGVTDHKGSVAASVEDLVNSSAGAAKTTWSSSGFEKVGNSMANGAAKSVNKFVASSTNKVKTLVNNSVDRYSRQIDKKLDGIDKSVESKTDKISKAADAKVARLERQKKGKKGGAAARIDDEIRATKESAAKRIKSIKDGAKKEKEELQKSQKAYKDAGKASIAAYGDALDDFASAAKEAVSAAMDKVNEEFQAKYDELVQKREALESVFMGAGSLFTRDDAGRMTLEDLNRQAADIEKYARNLEAIKGKVSDDLFAEIAGMSMEDGQEYVSRLLSMGDAGLARYNEAYTRKAEAARNLSSEVYQDDMDRLNSDYNAAVDKALAGVSEKMQGLGKDAMKGFISGMESQKGGLEKAARKVASGIVKQFKKKLKIHSPSKVMRDDVGKNLALGIGEGFSGQMKDVSSMMADEVPTRYGQFAQAKIAGARQERADYAAAFKNALSTVSVRLDEKAVGQFVEETIARGLYA